MRKVFTVVAATLFAGAAIAETPVAATGPVLSGEMELVFSQDATTDEWGGAMGIDLGIDAAGLATVDLDLTTEAGSAVDLTDWTVSGDVANVGIAFGTDNGVFVGAEGEQTLAAPAMTESLAVSMGAASVAVGFTDWTTDLTDISNIQGSYALNVAGYDVTAAGDYNLDTENTVVGGTVGGLNFGEAALSGTVTYDTDAEAFGFEGVANAYGVTAYLNGDDTDSLQNVGGEYVYTFAPGTEFTAGANYNLDSEDLNPTATMSFAF